MRNNSTTTTYEKPLEFTTEKGPILITAYQNGVLNVKAHPGYSIEEFAKIVSQTFIELQGIEEIQLQFNDTVVTVEKFSSTPEQILKLWLNARK